MSVAFLMHAPDIPSRVAGRVCEDYNTFTWGEPDGIRVDVTFQYDDMMRAKYPQLYPEWYEGKNCRQIADELGKIIRQVREHEPFARGHKPENRRFSQQVSGLAQVYSVCLDHPDWMLTLND
ncbi:hypothetical protein [Bifidobacterium felsineum]|uniref:hypothetical protein n=1 Tax=Bifidobacterium felsineum TaxID=2045440 RepID=UPI001BDBE7D4|nr:hypothetical protein [Bifidobacterium felsineum]MBT1164590.1 hypothetical protein [Bifidobacterium felsineum]